MIQRKFSLRHFAGAVSAACVIAFPFLSVAESYNDVRDEVPYVVGDGPVEVYGQVLEPNEIKPSRPNYSWKQLKHFMPQVLPDAQKSSKTPEALCDHLKALTRSYAITVDEAEYSIGPALADKYDGSPFGEGVPFDLGVSHALASPEEGAFEKLLELLPEKRVEILLAREIVLKYLTLLYVHDAAIENCPAYAEEKGYSRIYSYEP